MLLTRPDHRHHRLRKSSRCATRIDSCNHRGRSSVQIDSREPGRRDFGRALDEHNSLVLQADQFPTAEAIGAIHYFYIQLCLFLSDASRRVGTAKGETAILERKEIKAEAVSLYLHIWPSYFGSSYPLRRRGRCVERLLGL